MCRAQRVACRKRRLRQLLRRPAPSPTAGFFGMAYRSWQGKRQALRTLPALDAGHAEWSCTYAVQWPRVAANSRLVRVACRSDTVLRHDLPGPRHRRRGLPALGSRTNYGLAQQPLPSLLVQFLGEPRLSRHGSWSKTPLKI